MFNLKKYKVAQNLSFEDFSKKYEDKRLHDNHYELSEQILPWLDKLVKKIHNPEDFVYHEGFYYPIDEIEEGKNGIYEDRDQDIMTIRYYENGFVLGIITLRDYEDHVCLEDIAVVPWARGQGVGTKLYMEAGKYVDLSDPNSTCETISDSALKAKYNAYKQMKSETIDDK